MKLITIEKMREIFGEDIPDYAMQFMLSVPDDTSEENIIMALRTFSAAKGDARVQRALEVARTVYAHPGKTFDESYTKEQGGQILAILARVFIAVFKDIDLRQA